MPRQDIANTDILLQVATNQQLRINSRFSVHNCPV